VNEPQAENPPGPYYLAPTPCQQVEESHRLILAAADTAKTGRALILGAGRSAEIPLAVLATRFERITINDIDRVELEQGLAAAGLDDAARAKLDVRVADLTGVTDELLGKINAALHEAEEPDAAIETMARLVDEQTLPGMPIEGQYDLIVASCLMSQLHFALLHRASDAFEGRFHGEGERVRNSVRWTSSLYEMARRMEKQFVDDLHARLAQGGLIYLSDAPQMCSIKLTADGQWQTEGTHRLLRTKNLTDYLDKRFVTVAHQRWHWITFPPQEPGQSGRLFDVQAVVLRAWRAT